MVPADIRRKHGITTGTRAEFSEDHLGRIILVPVTEDYIDRISGCLSDGPDLLASWLKEHRAEGEREW